MHAIRQHQFGAPDVLRYEQLPDPEPGPGQLRIAVLASGVHLLDTKIRAGEAGGPFPLPALPMTPGREVAGTVDAVGPDVDRAWLGRRVVGHLGQASGGYAELALAAADAVHPIPDGLAAPAAVAMIGTGRTTLAILEAAPPAADDVVLVPAAAGGIGNLLVQAARAAGATVVGLAGGPEKTARVAELGATIALDYDQDGWAARLRDALGERRATVVYDGVGGPVGRAALELLGPRGRLVLFGWSAGAPTRLDATDVLGRGISVTGAIGPRVLAGPNGRGGLRAWEVAALEAAASGRLRPLVGPPFPLAAAADAHRALVARRTIGKTVLVP
ncbi:zinc-binding dehydrogenase [Patulibacter defluvii]|uniref:zinc-binding dehydrogenase n=1 Tax=Patulibacter defluvii TaxID=3095358 RepID=UPI002A74EF64|nr:zinc-binding dehydrogenase [Patulibacter sp. DM4]